MFLHVIIFTWSIRTEVYRFLRVEKFKQKGEKTSTFKNLHVITRLYM